MQGPCDSQSRAVEAAFKGSDLKCHLKTSFADLDGLRADWDEAVVQLGGSIYMSYDWVRTWWEVYGAGRELRVFLFYSAGKIVGIVPIYVDALGFWPVQIRVARLLGASIPPKVFDPPLDEVLAEAMFERILLQLFQEDGCDLLSFGPVSDLHGPTEALRRVCAARKSLVARHQVVPEGVHALFALPGSLEDYFGGLSKSERKKRKYELRLLQKECEVKTDVVSDAAGVEREFGRFVAQHAAQWEVEGRPGHFGAWPRAKEFNESLVKAHGRLGRVRFIRIVADGRLVSSQYVFAFGDWYFWELPARTMGRELGQAQFGCRGRHQHDRGRHPGGQDAGARRLGPL